MTTKKQLGTSNVAQQPAKAKTKTDLLIAEAAARLAAAAPPLSDWQRTRIAELFSAVVQDRHQTGHSATDQT